MSLFPQSLSFQTWLGNFSTSFTFNWPLLSTNSYPHPILGPFAVWMSLFSKESVCFEYFSALTSNWPSFELDFQLSSCTMSYNWLKEPVFRSFNLQSCQVECFFTFSSGLLSAFQLGLFDFIFPISVHDYVLHLYSKQGRIYFSHKAVKFIGKSKRYFVQPSFFGISMLPFTWKHL